ncbi:HTH_Tnp_Tc3_2 domain-containing protein [Trichonephila clavipes]|nr:HTH_Tnp_Tc3_2 domain-containing protein [Trichonephila clavipes]
MVVPTTGRIYGKNVWSFIVGRSQKVECTVAEGQRNTNDREDRAIRRVATSAPTTSLAYKPPSRHLVPSRETIRRRLTEVGLRSRRPLRRLPLTPHYRQCRLDFCRPRALEWTETSSPPHTCLSDPAYCRAAYQFHKVTVWGAISSLCGPSRHFDSSQIRGRYFNADCATHAIKSPRCHLPTE